MKIIKKETKKGQELLSRVRFNEGFSLKDVYKNWSTAKEISYRECLSQCKKENGKDFHICSHNCNFYSVTWQTEQGTRIETAYNSYLIA